MERGYHIYGGKGGGIDLEGLRVNMRVMAVVEQRGGA